MTSPKYTLKRWSVIGSDGQESLLFSLTFSPDIALACDWLLPSASSHGSQSHLPILPVTYAKKWHHIRQPRYAWGLFFEQWTVFFEGLNRNGNNNFARREKCVLTPDILDTTHLFEGRCHTCRRFCIWLCLTGVIWNSKGSSCVIMGCGLQVPLQAPRNIVWRLYQKHSTVFQ